MAEAIRIDLWRRIESAIKILAEGACLQVEIEQRLEICGGASKRLFDALVEHGWAKRNLFVNGQTKYGVLQLTEEGRALARELGCEIRPSDWDILAQKHNAEEHHKHAFAVLLFAFHARKRGWRVEVCPTVDNPLAKPDILVEKDGERVYVEVEVLRHPRKRRDGADNTWVRKWRNQRDFQKRVAVCTLTPKRRAGIVAYLRPRMPGMATDLATLARRPDSDLWVERWNWPNEFSMRG